MRKIFSSFNWKDHLINFIVVIVGVTIAFQLSNRKEKSDQRQLERNSLESIVLDLDDDIYHLEQSTDTIKILKSRLEYFVANLYQKKVNRDSLIDLISIQYVQSPFIPRDNTYQSLLTSGKLDVIDDFELRKQLTQLYHGYYQSIKLIDQLSAQQKNELILPYLMTLDHGNPGSINVYEPSFVNSNSYSLYYLTQKLAQDQIALNSAVQLREDIKKKLKD